MEWCITTPDEMSAVAADIVRSCPPAAHATVLALSGDLGAGKTTLVQALATQLGVREVVTSPTFVLLKQYETAEPWEQLIHIDVYRIEDPAELKRLGFVELCALPNTVICLEWPERVATLVPSNAHHITLTIHGSERRITLQPYAEKN